MRAGLAEIFKHIGESGDILAASCVLETGISDYPVFHSIVVKIPCRLFSDACD